ncbi:hypothetical protein D4739_04090 [Nocardioides cavernaquae]|uniref:Uncharacterized protein n=2 Tax=Nocardioides cavernaquae TaxID=2321396 RepID=A0A3A5HBR3_9ACTN|nr:hypothetical protein D4739_04090 [Nocardioides cavernaquae]
MVHVLALVLVLSGVIAVLHRSGVVDLPGRDDTPRLESWAFPSVLNVVGPQTTSVGGSVPLLASSYGASPAKRVRLFDGARQVGQSDGVGTAGAVRLDFPALSVGSHLVHIEVESTDGEISRSVPVAIAVAPGAQRKAQPKAQPKAHPKAQPKAHQAPGQTQSPEPDQDFIPVPVQVFDGEGAKDVAARLGLPADQLVVSRRKAIALVAPDAGVAAITGSSAVVDVPDLPARLALTAEPTGCGVELKAANRSGEVTFWHSSSSIPGWAEVSGATRDRAAIKLLAAGPHLFHATDDEGVSGQVQVTVPASCAERAGWKGNASIVNGILKTPAGAGWLLLSVDGRPWLRVPQSPSQSLPLYPGANVAAYLPALDGHRLDLEVWKGTKEFENPPTEPLATGSLTVPEGVRLADIVGEPSALTLTSADISNYPPVIDTGHDHRSIDFSWQAASSRVDRVVWQVIAGPIDPNDLSLVPPGLIAAGIADADGGTAKDGGRAGTFSIDTAKIPLDASEPLSSEYDATPAQPGVAQILAPPIDAASAPTLAGAKYGKITPVTDLGSAVMNPVTLPREGDEVHVRVLTDPKNPWAASAPVTLRMPTHETKSSQVSVTLDEVRVDAGRAPYAPAMGCVYVDVPWQGTQLRPEMPNGMFQTAEAWDSYYEKSSIAAASAYYPVSGVHCPGEFAPAECDDLICGAIEFVVDAAGVVVGFIIEAVSLVSYVYNGVINAVVEAIAKYNPLCVGLGAAGGDDEACATVVGIATRAAVTAALASVGLPPALPSGDALVAAASGEFAQLGADLMASAGIPCEEVKAPPGFGAALDQASSALDAPKVGNAAEDPCLAVATLLLDSVRDQVGAEAMSTVGSASGLPSFPGVEGFTMTPDPRAELQPLRVDVKAHLTKASADGTGVVCKVRVVMPNTSGQFRSIPPWGSWVFGMREQTPIDGKGAWAGGSALGVNRNSYADAVAQLQPRTVDVQVEAASGCTFEPRVVAATIRPAEPDLDKFVTSIATPEVVVVSD